MQSWDDYRFALALIRSGSMVGAATKLGVSPMTVPRRVTVLERALGVALFLRGADNRYRLTDLGEKILPDIEELEGAVGQAQEAAGQARSAVSGLVRITAVPVVANRLLMPRLGPLLAAHSELNVEIVPEPQDRNLTQREADIALRLSRPSAGGGQDATARKIGLLGYRACQAAGVKPPLPWISYEDSMGHLPHARWLANAAKECRGSRLRVSDVETAFEAVAAGLGQSLLPQIVADGDRRVVPCGRETVLEREVWMLGLTAQTKVPRVAAVKEWLMSVPWR